MKKCEYCAKEISYHEMYCSDECQNNANRFYEMRDKYQKAFGVINGICVIAVGIFIFLYSFLQGTAAMGASFALMILGIMYFFLPFPPDVMIHKYKLSKSLKITKIIALVVFVIGLIVLILSLTGIL